MIFHRKPNAPRRFILMNVGGRTGYCREPPFDASTATNTAIAASAAHLLATERNIDTADVPIPLENTLAREFQVISVVPKATLAPCRRRYYLLALQLQTKQTISTRQNRADTPNRQHARAAKRKPAAGIEVPLCS
jgi:hypothetical protein